MPALINPIGQAKKADPTAYFHIISRDKDFDALVGHLKDNGTFAARHAAFNEIPVLMHKAERAEYAIQHYKSKNGSRASKRKTMEPQIQSLFARTLPPAELEELIAGLIARKALEITANNDVVYHL